jgi:hypothetical protein
MVMTKVAPRKKRMQPYVLVEMFSIIQISFFIQKVNQKKLYQVDLVIVIGSF